MAYDERLAARVRKVLGNTETVTEKRMFGGLAFLDQGLMFCGITDDRLMVRVGPEAHQDALSLPHVRPMDFTGRPMRGYVYVAAAGLATTPRLKTWVIWGRNFVATLAPKPSVDVELALLLRACPPPIKSLMAAARTLVKHWVPDVVEGVRVGWKLLGFSAPRYFACLAPSADRVRLGFEHGILLDDPDGLLEMGGTQMKWITLAKRSDLQRPGLAALVAQAADLARAGNPAKPRRRVI